MMAKVTTAFGQTIALEVMQSGEYVLTLEHDDGTILAQIGMEPNEYFTLIDAVTLKPQEVGSEVPTISNGHSESNEPCSYTGGEDLPKREYNWQEIAGIEGPVLVCVRHGLPAQGEVYNHLDSGTTAGIRCQAFEIPESTDSAIEGGK